MMTAEVTPDDSSALAQALALGSLGYKIVPLPPGEKYPKGLAKWQERATDDATQITDWWGTGEAGIGWAMGRQPNGTNLVAIDVDVADGKQGKATLAALVRDYDLTELVRNTVVSITGSGGRHIVVEVGDTDITNRILGPGLDLRGEGGFIVVPPSVHPNGERYRWMEGRSPFDLDPAPASAALVEFLAGRGEGRETEPGPQPLSNHEEEPNASFTGDPTPADWVRATHSIPEMLTEAGWACLETRGDDTYWVRPDKNPRDGHSAVLHGEAPLVVWSTSAPAEFWRVGRDNRDGSRSLSPLDVYAAIRHGGDIAAASSAVRRQMPRTVEAPGVRSGGLAVVGVAGEESSTPTGLNLPPEFWTSKPWLTHVRDAAWSRLVSPDACLLSVLARYAALIPPKLQLPAIIGSPATFDFIGCSVASSSGGKSVANRVAEELLPIQRKDIQMDLPVGSGEGVIQSFMVPEVNDEGKPTGRQVVGMTATHFTVDEGTALMEQQARKGTTIVQTLCSAWSGSVLGQANAGAETRRIIDARRVRLSAVINIQTANGHLLLQDYMTAVGLPQRVLFAYAHAPLPPLEDLPEWPGPLDLDIPPTMPHVSYLPVTPTIAQEVREQRFAIATGALALDALDGHLTLLQLKLAGIACLMDGRDLVDDSDWAFAAALVGSSISVRTHLLAAKRRTDEERTVAKVARSVTEEELAHRQKVARLADKIAEKVGPEPMSVSHFRNTYCSTQQKEILDEAIALAAEMGRVVVDEGVTPDGRPARSLRAP